MGGGGRGSKNDDEFPSIPDSYFTLIRATANQASHVNTVEGQNGWLGSFILIKHGAVVNELMGHYYNIILEKPNVELIK
jgi:hypothetical protein